MPSFDTTNVAAEVNPHPIDIAQTLGGFANLQNAFNQNKMFQAKALAGQYMEQATDPTTGQPDPGKLNSFLTKDARTAPYAPEIMQSAFAQQGAGLQNQQTGVNLASSQFNNARNISGNAAAASLASSKLTDPDAKRTEAMVAAARAVSQAPPGLISPEISSGYLGSSDFANTVDAAITSGTAGTYAQAVRYGTPTPVQTGGATQFEAVKPGDSGSVTPMAGGVIPNSQSPAERGQFVTYQGSDNSQHQVAKSAIQTAQGVSIPNVKDAEGNQITDSTGALTTALSANDAALLNSTATNQADRASSLQSSFENSTARKALIEDMIGLNGDFKSGPGASKWSDIVTEANRIFGTNFSDNQTEAQQVFGKISEALSAQQRSTLGIPATNAGQQAAQLASPNSAYSPQANKQVLAQFAGNEDLLQRKEAAWTAYQAHGGKSYNTFIQQFNPVHDPRMFWEPYMDTAGKTALLNGMSPTEQQQYTTHKAQAAKLATMLGIQ